MEFFWFEILTFTVMQAALSALLSVILGGGLARFLWCYPGLRFEEPLKGMGQLTFVMPVMIPTLGLVWIFEGIGHGETIYGFAGIVLVHVFLNSAYCLLQLRGAYESCVSPSLQRQCDLLELNLKERLIYLEIPALRSTILNSFLVIFCLCLSSFSVVLLVGGGPASTTLSIALYHALSVSFDWKEAGFFLLLQLLVSLLFSLLLLHKKQPQGVSMRHISSAQSYGKFRGAKELFLGVVLMLYLLPLFCMLTTLVVPAEGLETLIKSVFLTLSLGGIASLFVLGISLGVLTSFLKKSKPLTPFFSMAIYLCLSVPKLFLVGSIFLMCHSFLQENGTLYFLMAGVTLLIYLPFSLKSFLSDFIIFQGRYGYQIHLLNLSSFEIFMSLIWPSLSTKIKGKFAMIMCFSMGNLSIPLLLGQMEVKTLPVLIYESFVRYDTETAAFYMACLTLLMGSIYGMSHVQNQRKGRADAKVTS